MATTAGPLKSEGRISESKLRALADDFVKGFVEGLRLEATPRGEDDVLRREGEIYLYGADSSVLDYISHEMQEKFSGRKIKGLKIVVGEPKSWQYSINVEPFLNGHSG